MESDVPHRPIRETAKRTRLEVDEAEAVVPIVTLNPCECGAKWKAFALQYLQEISIREHKGSGNVIASVISKNSVMSERRRLSLALLA